jgi:tetratricopeptide (TPR) repeat protein
MFVIINKSRNFETNFNNTQAMKKSLFLLSLFLISTFLYAQPGKVTSALNLKDSGKLEQALAAIEEAVDANNPKAAKSVVAPRTWEVRGEIYQAIFQSKDAAVRKLTKDPLSEALNSYKKALELDTRGRLAKSIKVKLTLLTNDLTNQAVESFNEEDFGKALLSFEQILELQDLPVIKEDNPAGVDTIIVFNAGLAAFNAQNYSKAIQYYKVAAELGYNEARSWQLLSKAHLENKDTLNALTVLQNGFQRYPADNGILVEMINIYLGAQKTDEAMKYLNLAIEQDPENATYYFAQGTLHDMIGQPENAIISYENAIKVNPEYFDAYYNLGALYYNNGVKQQEIANKVPASDNTRYEAEVQKADEWFSLALPLMEKCQELNPKEPYSLESLRNLYYRLKMLDKYEEVLKIIENQ